MGYALWGGARRGAARGDGVRVGGGEGVTDGRLLLVTAAEGKARGEREGGYEGYEDRFNDNWDGVKRKKGDAGGHIGVGGQGEGWARKG